MIKQFKPAALPVDQQFVVVWQFNGKLWSQTYKTVGTRRFKYVEEHAALPEWQDAGSNEAVGFPFQYQHEILVLDNG